ncbi:nucleolar GTP-binding protein [Coemansia spiralis]|nr:nucleolar GTP-binding protein [Coemansia spiralis]
MPPRSKVNSSLGKAIIRKRFEGKRPVDKDTELHTTDLNDGPSWTKLQSITEQGDLEEFLHTAELAGTEFTAERMNVKIISTKQTTNPFLLTADEEEKTLQKHREYNSRLKVPRRPEWDSKTTAGELHRAERAAFMSWRRELAQLQEEEGLLLTPFERNLEVWRQLWRVLERSHLVVQIVDARNPMLFRSEDLVEYVEELDERKKCILLINKADMLTESQRDTWAKYFEERDIKYLFFSAKVSNEEIQLEREREEAIKLAEDLNRHMISDRDEVDPLEGDQEASNDKPAQELTKEQAASAAMDEFETKIKAVELAEADLRTRVLSPTELVSILIRECPSIANEHSHNKLMIGLVGYPNVGKSSTINALVGSKKVNVGSMPGKTKHFQTIHLTRDVVLCDCPGLVFPTFATTQADMVCNGVLPIDQLREFTGPSALVAKRIPKWVIEAVYGIEIRTRAEEEGGSGIPTAEELLTSYAAARGMFKGGEGNPDESRAARVLLKDYVNGKLIYCHPPPNWPNDNGIEFNKEHYDPVNVARRTRHLVENGSNDDNISDGAQAYTVKHAASDRRNVKKVIMTSSGSIKVDALDRQFFNTGAALANAKLRGKSHQVKQGRGYAQMQHNGRKMQIMTTE